MKRLSSIFAWLGTAVLALGVGVGIVIATTHAIPLATTSHPPTTAAQTTIVAPTTPSTTSTVPTYTPAPVTTSTKALPTTPVTTTSRPVPITTPAPYTGDGSDNQSYAGSGSIPTDN